MARILTVTLNPAIDLTMDLPVLHLGEVNRSETEYIQAAGKGLNVAQVLADLGNQVTVTGFLGEDNPQRFEQLFEACGFADEFLRVPGETRSNIKLTEHDGRVTDINGPGFVVAEAAQREFMERLQRLAPLHEAVVVAGSLPRGIGVTWFVDLLQLVKRLGVRLALDTSGDALRAGLMVKPWLIKPNGQELAEACAVPLGSDLALSEQARHLQAGGIEHVVVSLGPEGANWFGAGGVWHSRPPRVAVVSTVGAGDSLLAGVLHGLLKDWPLERTLRHATAISAEVVGQIAFGITDRAKLAELEAGVTLAFSPA